jgi:hypothetical protein
MNQLQRCQRLMTDILLSNFTPVPRTTRLLLKSGVIPADLKKKKAHTHIYIVRPQSNVLVVVLLNPFAATKTNPISCVLHDWFIDHCPQNSVSEYRTQSTWRQRYLARKCKAVLIHDRKTSTNSRFLSIFCIVVLRYGRSQWPSGLRHELSSLARTLGS